MCLGGDSLKGKKTNPWAPYNNAFEKMCAGIAKKPKRISELACLVRANNDEVQISEPTRPETKP